MLLTELRQGIADPYNAISQIRDEMNQLFQQGPGRTPYYPPLNVWQSEKEVMVTGELAGVLPEDIHISVEGKTLMIEGIRKWIDNAETQNQLNLSECYQGVFKRRVELPYIVDKNKVQAKYSKGVLTIVLPRAEEDIPQKITVEAA